MPLNNTIPLKIGNETLERYGEDCNSKSFKFVGIQLDEFLTWKHHISVIRKKIACANFKINQCKNFISSKPRLLLYNSMIKPHLEFGNIIWGGVSEQKLRCLTEKVYPKWPGIFVLILNSKSNLILNSKSNSCGNFCR